MMGEDQLQRHIERVLGRDDKPEDWRALHAAAEAAPTTWKHIASELPASGPFFGGASPHLGDFAIFHWLDLSSLVGGFSRLA